jgi:hypothetical protein
MTFAIELNRDVFSFAAVSKFVACNPRQNGHLLDLLRSAPCIPEVLDTVIRLRLVSIAENPTPEGSETLIQLLKAKPPVDQGDRSPPQVPAAPVQDARQTLRRVS